MRGHDDLNDTSGGEKGVFQISWNLPARNLRFIYQSGLDIADMLMCVLKGCVGFKIMGTPPSQLVPPHVRQLWLFCFKRSMLNKVELQQWRRIRANSEMHLTVLSRVEDESRFSSGIQSNWNQYDDHDWICDARE